MASQLAGSEGIQTSPDNQEAEAQPAFNTIPSIPTWVNVQETAGVPWAHNPPGRSTLLQGQPPSAGWLTTPAGEKGKVLWSFNIKWY